MFSTETGCRVCLTPQPAQRPKSPKREKTPERHEHMRSALSAPSLDQQRVIHSCHVLSILGAPLGCACIAFLIYRNTAYPSVSGGDSGELLAEACVGGVAHPPGYALYLAILSRLFAWFPGRRPARVATLFSIGCSSIATISVGAVASIWALSFGKVYAAHAPLAGLVASSLFATSPLVWEYAIQPEVFALNNALCSLGALASALIATLPSSVSCARRATVFGALLVGLSAAHQQASLLSAAPLALNALWHIRHHLTWSWFLEIWATAFAGLAIPTFIFLPARSASATEGSWGDLTHWKGLWRHVTRAEYGERDEDYSQ